ncbi:MAG TPA: RDD family protein [Sulfurovum sp.]|nr:RDD family protein [Sulfurovum sp.]
MNMNMPPVASTQKRMLSFVIDDLMIAFLLLAIYYEQLIEIASTLSGTMTAESMELFQNAMQQFFVNNLLFILTLRVLYHTIFIWQNGMTLGKYFMKIRVISLKTDTQQNLTFSKSFLRALLRIVSEVVFYLGFLLAFFLPLNQTLHDKLSHSVVVDA